MAAVPHRSHRNRDGVGLGTGQAGESQTLWECSSYTGDAHTRCLEGFAESQRDQIAALQGKLQAQQETVKLLKDQLDRQTSTSAELQRQLGTTAHCRAGGPSPTPIPPWDLAFLRVGPGSTGHHFFTAHTSTAHTTTDRVTGATVDNDWLVWLIWLIWFFWLVKPTKTNQTNQTDQMKATFCQA